MPPYKILPLVVACLSLAIPGPVRAESRAPAPTKNTRFLLERIKAITDSGIVGVPVGTQVEIVSKNGNTLKVKALDGTTFDVTPAQVTDDAAKALASKEQTDAIDAEAKAKRDAIIAAQAAKILADKQRESSAAEAIATTDTNPRIAPVTTPSAFVPGGTSLDGGAHSAGVTVHKREKPKAKK